jgi:hypothetical protein
MYADAKEMKDANANAVQWMRIENTKTSEREGMGGFL